MVDLKHFGVCCTQQTEYKPDGSEGTVTVQWFNGGESPVITVGCVVKNDKTFRDLIDTAVTEETKYFAYTCGITQESSKATIRIHRFKKPEKEKKCTVDDVVNKKMDLVDHEYTFLPCEERNFNRSSFLEEHSISVESSTLSPRKVCKDGKVMIMGLCKERPKGLLKFFECEINRQESNSDRFCIEDSVFDKLVETGPLLISHEKSKTLVGYYRKSSENHITISTLKTHAETIDVCRNSHCAGRQSSSTTTPEPDASHQQQNYTKNLKSSIREQTEFLRIRKEKKIRIDNIFTDLTIQRGQKDKENFGEVKASITTLKNFSEMFICPENDDPKSKATVETNPKSILLIGKAGIGKTLLCKKLVRDWANDSLFEKEEKSKAPIFEVVLLLTFRQLNQLGQKELDLRDILNCSSLLNERSIIDEALLQYIIENPEKLFLIIDGYDEYNYQDKITSDFQTGYSNDPSKEIPVPAMIAKLLKGKMLKDSVVLISSRPGEAEAVKEIAFDATVEITGFSSPQVMKYVENYFQENESLKNAVLDHINANDFFVSFGEIPVMCYLMCYYMEWHVTESRTARTLPVTRTNLYHEVIKVFIKKHHGDSKYREMTEREIQETLLKLAELAFNLTREKKYIFEEEDMKKLNLSEREITNLKASGLLDCCPGVKTSPFDEPTLQYVFTHLTIQEYLCAVRCVETKQIPGKKETSGVTLIFMAGLLSRNKDENFIKKLVKNIEPRDEYDNINKLLVLNVLREYGDVELSKLIIDNLYHKYCNSYGRIGFGVTLSYLDCVCISYLLNVIKLTNTHLTSHKHSVNTLYIHHSSLSSSCVQVLCQSLVLHHNITTLVLWSCELDDKCVDVIANYLLRTKITHLILRGNNITDVGVKCVCDVLIKDNCCIEVLDLRGNRKITVECKEYHRNLVQKRKPRVRLIFDW